MWVWFLVGVTGVLLCFFFFHFVLPLALCGVCWVLLVLDPFLLCTWGVFLPPPISIYNMFAIQKKKVAF
jgi:hypothetical protein